MKRPKQSCLNCVHCGLILGYGDNGNWIICKSGEPDGVEIAMNTKCRMYAWDGSTKEGEK